MHVVRIFKNNMDLSLSPQIYTSHLLSAFFPFEASNKNNHSLMTMEIYLYTTEKSTKHLFKLVIMKLFHCEENFRYLQIKESDNDGVLLFDHFKRCSTDMDICQLISQLEGCFAFVYYQVGNIQSIEFTKSAACIEEY